MQEETAWKIDREVVSQDEECFIIHNKKQKFAIESQGKTPYLIENDGDSVLAASWHYYQPYWDPISQHSIADREPSWD